MKNNLPVQREAQSDFLTKGWLKWGREHPPLLIGGGKRNVEGRPVDQVSFKAPEPTRRGDDLHEFVWGEPDWGGWER